MSDYLLQISQSAVAGNGIGVGHKCVAEAPIRNTDGDRQKA